MTPARLAPDHAEIERCVGTLFARAPEGVVSLRAFYDDKKGDDAPFAVVPVDLDGRRLGPLVEAAFDLARKAARAGRPVVVGPPVAVFSDRKRADEVSLHAALVLVVELDERPAAGLARLRGVLGPPTLVLTSGGTWTDPETGEIQNRLHAYWRLREPATAPGDVVKVKRALGLMCRLVGAGADTSATSPVHPLRLGGTVHRKNPADPRLCRTVEENAEIEVDLGDALARLEAVLPPERKPQRSSASGGGGESPFQAINRAALRDPDSWLPDLFPGVRRSGTATRRIRSRDIGRDNQEDISVHPGGIKDFGVHDLDDPRQGRRSAIDLVMEHVGLDLKGAAAWLAERLGMGFEGFEGDPSGRVGGSRPPPEWPDPEPLAAELPAVEPFDDALLPPVLRPWVDDVARRMQVPPEFVAVPAIVCAGALIGRRLGIRPKRRDDWTVVPNLWGGVIGRPGVLKTPALDEGKLPLVVMEVGEAARHAGALRLAEAERTLAAAERKDKEKELRKRLGAGEDRDALRAELAAAETPEPVRKRFVVNDTTVEKLGEILRDNPNGVLLFRDELTGFLRGLEREGRESDRAFYLEAWNGTGRFTYDRIGRGTTDIEAAIVSVLGGIQPSPLAAYLGTVRAGGANDDGLLQRFQLLVWPDQPADWENVDEYPLADARKAAFAAFAGLATLDVASAAAEWPTTAHIPFARFGPAAQEGFDTWRADLERRLHSGDLDPALESHLAKYRSLVPSLALISHLLEGGRGPIDVVHLERATTWAEYLEGHAKRVYHLLLRGETLAARSLARKIQAGLVGGEFTLRDIHQRDWAQLTDRDTVQAALDLLEEAGWVRWRVDRNAKGGRPTRIYTVNPKAAGGGP